MHGCADPLDRSKTKAKGPHICFYLKPDEGDRLMPSWPLDSDRAALVCTDIPTRSVSLASYMTSLTSRAAERCLLVGVQEYGWRTTTPPSPRGASVAQVSDIIVESGEPMVFTPARNPRVDKLPPSKPREYSLKRILLRPFPFALFGAALLLGLSLDRPIFGSWRILHRTRRSPLSALSTVTLIVILRTHLRTHWQRAKNIAVKQSFYHLPFEARCSLHTWERLYLREKKKEEKKKVEAQNPFLTSIPPPSLHPQYIHFIWRHQLDVLVMMLVACGTTKEVPFRLTTSSAHLTSCPNQRLQKNPPSRRLFF